MSKILPNGYALPCRPEILATPQFTGIFYVNYWYIFIVTGSICTNYSNWKSVGFCSNGGLVHFNFFNPCRIYTLNAEECSKRDKSESYIRVCVIRENGVTRVLLLR
jgi:hypothetical protein